jgi:hypothetical protein
MHLTPRAGGFFDRMTGPASKRFGLTVEPKSANMTTRVPPASFFKTQHGRGVTRTLLAEGFPERCS